MSAMPEIDEDVVGEWGAQSPRGDSPLEHFRTLGLSQAAQAVPDGAVEEASSDANSPPPVPAAPPPPQGPKEGELQPRSEAADNL